MVSISNVLFGLLFVAVGLGIGGFAVHDGYMSVQDVNSAVETTEGTIQSSDVVEDREYEDDETELEYYPRITYEYTVDGQTHTGERIYSHLDRNQEPGELPGVEYDAEWKAREEADRYQPGSRVTVYYYPGNPERSFLVKPKVDWAELGMMAGFGGIFALAGLGAMFSDD